MKRNLLILIYFLLRLLCPSTASAQPQTPQEATPDSIRISLLTCASGGEIYSLFGHTAIRYENFTRGIDAVFNYGMFNFNAPNFIFRFSLGETDYQLGATDYERFAAEYAFFGRSVWQQTLNLTDEEKSVLATITVGYRQAMSREVRNRFSVTGVAHILAVSGFHVAIVCGFLSFLFSFLSRNGCCRWIRYISLLVLLWGFVAITGLAASSVRAALMLTMYLTGGVLDRRAERYNILAASAFCMLVYEPLYLFDIGFQLSYLAVLSILYFQPRLQALIKVHNPFLRTPWGWVTVTLSAQAGTTFLCLYYFGQFSTVFLLTNLPLTFLATLLIPASLVYMFLPEWIPGYGWLQVGVEWLAHDLLWVVDAFSQVPGAVFSFRFDFPAMLVAYGMLLSILLYGHTGRSRYLLVILFLLLIILLVRVIEDLKQCGI